MNPAVISELLAGAKCFQCLTPRQRNRLNAYLLSRQSPGPGPGPDPEPPIDPSACAVEDVTDGGGDTFDCYNEGVFTTLPSYAGTGFDGGWMYGSMWLADDTFDDYSDGVKVTDTMNGGTGHWDGYWRFS